MFPPAVECGVFELTAFWLLDARPMAHWLVSAFWRPTWKPPAPPQPSVQPEPPMFCVRPWCWCVSALFETFAVALDVAFWVAELGPEEMFPPAIETGAFPFTAFCLLAASPRASWLVSAFWTPAWKPPAPPQPAEQPSLPSRPSLLPRMTPSRPFLSHPPPVLLPPMFWQSSWSWLVS